MTEKTIEESVDAASKLLSLEAEDLYAILGAQLLGRAVPTRAAGIVTFLSAVRRAEKAVTFIDILRPGLTESGEWLELIHEELKRDGVRYLAEASGDLRRALCNDDILRLSEDINRSSLQVIIMVVGNALKLSSEFESIAVTATVILLKMGLRQFCT